MPHIEFEVTVRDLVPADLAHCEWAGSKPHLENMATQLERARAGAVEYLAVCGPADQPLCVGGIDYEAESGSGTIWQLGTMPALRSAGLGSMLIGAAEDRIRARGPAIARLSVEDDNPRALALYERLGYLQTGETEHESWIDIDDDGRRCAHHARCIVLEKPLRREGADGAQENAP